MASAAENIETLHPGEIAKEWESRLRGGAVSNGGSTPRPVAAAVHELLGAVKVSDEDLEKAADMVAREEGGAILETVKSDDFKEKLLKIQNDRENTSNLSKEPDSG